MSRISRCDYDYSCINIGVNGKVGKLESKQNLKKNDYEKMLDFISLSIEKNILAM